MYASTTTWTPVRIRVHRRRPRRHGGSGNLYISTAVQIRRITIVSQRGAAMTRVRHHLTTRTHVQHRTISLASSEHQSCERTDCTHTTSKVVRNCKHAYNTIQSIMRTYTYVPVTCHASSNKTIQLHPVRARSPDQQLASKPPPT